MRDPVYASLLRRYVPDLPDTVARQAEQAALRDPESRLFGSERTST
jgi:hypothetical protein